MELRDVTLLQLPLALLTVSVIETPCSDILSLQYVAAGALSHVSPHPWVCVECLIGKQKKPILFKVTVVKTISNANNFQCQFALVQNDSEC